MNGEGSPTAALRRSFKQMLDLQDDRPASEADVDHGLQARAAELTAYWKAVHETMAVQPVLSDYATSTMSAIQQRIGHSKLAILDVEIEGVKERISLLVSSRSGDRDELTRLQDALFDISARLQDPELQQAAAQDGGDVDRAKTCKELFSSLIDVELRWVRGGAQLELLDLRKELESLEQEDAEASQVVVDPMDQLYLRVNSHLEDATQQLQQALERQVTTEGPRSKLTSSSVKQAAELARISNPIFSDYDDAVTLISQETQIDLTYVPSLKYPIGMDETTKTPVIAIEADLLAQKYQSQWHYISRHRKEATTTSAWNKAFGILSPMGEEFPVVHYTPAQQVSLRGFFISTGPIRLSDYHRLIEIPQYGPRLKALLSAETLDSYRKNFVPNFIHGEQFGFTSHDKDSRDDMDDPVLELPFFKAQEFCNILGGRLPTWQEWETAARGEDGLLYPWGNTLDVNALTLDDSVPWKVQLRPVETATTFLHQADETKIAQGNSTRISRWGVYSYERSPFGLKHLARFGFEWNTANGDLGPQGPRTHVLRTLGDYYTQTIFEGEDAAKCGNHRSFTGPLLPLYAAPNRFTRCAAFRVVFVTPSATDADAGYSGPPTAGPTNLCQIEALKAARKAPKEPGLEEIHSNLSVRVSGCGGGILRGSSTRLGFCVGSPLPAVALDMTDLLLLIGMGTEKVLQVLGEAEAAVPHLFDCGTNWCYYSLGIQVTLEAVGGREIVREVQVFDSTADDLVNCEWNGFAGKLDLTGMPLAGLTLEALAQFKSWGQPDSQRALVVFYLREYGKVLPVAEDPDSHLGVMRKQHLAAFVSFEFAARPDHTISRVRAKVTR